MIRYEQTADEVRPAVETTLEQLRTTPGLRASVILASAQGIASEIGSWGTCPGPRVVLTDLPRGPDLALPLRSRLPPGPVTVLPLGTETEALGALVVVAERPMIVAVEVRELSAALAMARGVDRSARLLLDRELGRVVTELHDGVVQALVHLRFELDHLARHEDVREVGRLASFATEALADARGLMYGLQPPAGSLAYRLDTHLRELRLICGTSFRARGVVGLVPETELFRLVTGVVRGLVMAGAELIEVTLDGDVVALAITVTSDIDVVPSLGSERRMAAAMGVGLQVEGGTVHVEFDAVAEAS